VTGGSSGIGLATATLLAGRGARVSLLARDPTRLADASSAIRATHPDARVSVAAADVTDTTALTVAVRELESTQGPCDILVASAGAAHPGYFDRIPEQVFRGQMELDYFGTLWAFRAVVPGMLERNRGHLVAISSTAALVGVFGYSAYAPAKCAVRGLAETMRPELAPHGIVVACAYPPDTTTPGLERENQRKPPESARISARIKPLRAERVARAIVRGIERDRLVITADFQTAALAVAGGLLSPYVRRVTDRRARGD
jgi:3-dehydrosphinganine reductase